MKSVKTFRVFALACYLLGALAFIVFYVDYQVVYDIRIVFCFALYSLLSVITGCRYYNLLSSLTDKKLDSGFVVKVPAAMNLAGLIFPVKGGGLWLVLYIKVRYGLGVVRTIVLAFVNVILLVSLVVPFMLHFSGNFTITGLSGFVIFILCYSLGMIVFMAFWFRTRVFALRRIFQFGIIDILLTLVYLFILVLMARIVIQDEETVVYVSVVVLVLTSSLVKVTPGNIGVFEGLALVASALLPENGDVFPLFVAVYRLLSLAHAGLVGLPSMLSIFGAKELKALWLNSTIRANAKE